MANLTLQGWFDLLKPGKTPIFRHTKIALQALAKHSHTVTAREIAEVVLSDPMATLRVIFEAYMKTSRRFSGQIATVEAAVLMQGIGRFLDEAAFYPILEQSKAAQHPIVLKSLFRLLRIAQHSAWQARDFSVLRADIHAEEVQVAALLYYAPEFLFWLQAPHVAKKLARLRRSEPSTVAEREALGFELAPLRLKMLEAWSISDLTRDLLDPRHAGLPRQRILNACLDISQQSRMGWWHAPLAADFESLAEVVVKPVEEIASIVYGNAWRVARAGEWIPAPPAAAWLPMLPGEWPAEPDEDLGEEEAVALAPQPRPTPTPSPSSTPPPSKPAAARPAPASGPAGGSNMPAPTQVDPARLAIQPNSKVLDDTMQSIETHLDGTYTLTQMSAVILKGLHHGLGLTRILFGMLSPDGKRVKSRFTLGVPAGDPLRHFEFELASKDLFGLLMGKTQGVWLNPENRPKLWPRIDPKLQAMIGEGDFYAMALHVDGRPVCFIFGDRGAEPGLLDQETYAQFKTFCLTAGRGLGKIRT